MYMTTQVMTRDLHWRLRRTGIDMSIRLNQYRHDVIHIQIKKRNSLEIKAESKPKESIGDGATNKELAGTPLRYNDRYSLQNWREGHASKCPESVHRATEYDV